MYKKWKINKLDYKNNQNQEQNEYEKVAIWCNENGNYHIEEIFDYYVVVENEKPSEEEIIEQRINELKLKITNEYDYKQFKYIRGEYTEEEWNIIKSEIQSITSEINDLEKQLKKEG